MQLLEGAKAVGYQADDRTAISRALDKVERLKLAAIALMALPVEQECVAIEQRPKQILRPLGAIHSA